MNFHREQFQMSFSLFEKGGGKASYISSHLKDDGILRSILGRKGVSLWAKHFYLVKMPSMPQTKHVF